MKDERFIEQSVKGIQGLSPYVPGKPIDLIERELGLSDVIKLASNENPYGPSQKVIDKINKRLTDTTYLSQYPDGSGYHLKKKLALHHNLSSEQFVLGNGSNDVLDMICRCFATMGDEVIFSQYAFAVYALSTQAVGATAIVTPALNWGNDLDAMLASITDKTKLIFIANPNNPTGTCLSSDALSQFLSQVPEHVIVVIDEAYGEYASHKLSPFHTSYSSAINCLKDYPNLIITQTFSKAYALASLRVGYAISNTMISNLLNRVRQPFNNNSLALDAAEVALDDQAYIDKITEKNWQGMAFLTKEFERLTIDYIPSAGNFVCIDVGNAEAFDKALLNKGVITRPIANYGMTSHLRVTIGKKSENQFLIECLESVLSTGIHE